MKNLVYLVAMALLGACASIPKPARAISSSPPYHRFWRGKKLDSLEFARFASALSDRFVPATLDTGAGRGLIAYEPLLLDPASEAPGLPDEIALVSYRDQAAYDAIRSTPEGQAYAASHWELFDRARSGSLVPQPYQGDPRAGTAYDLDPSYDGWQQGASRVLIAMRPPGLSDADFLGVVRAQLEQARAAHGLRDAIALVDPSYVIEYQSWSAREAEGPALFEGLVGLRSWDLAPQPRGATRLLPETGINAQF